MLNSSTSATMSEEEWIEIKEKQRVKKLAAEGKRLFLNELGLGNLQVLESNQRKSGVTIVKCISEDGYKYMIRVVPSFKSELVETEHNWATHLKSIEHDCIVKVIDYIENDDCGYCYSIMPFYQFGDLRSLLNENKNSFSNNMIILIALQLSRALRFLHQGEKKIVHRDIDFDNIFVSKFNPKVDNSSDMIQIKLGDFEMFETVNLTKQISSGFGREHNYPPPNSDGKFDVGPSSEIWCLGVLIYRMITMDFKTDFSTFTLQKELNEKINEISDYNFRSILTKCLRINKDERIDSFTLTESLLWMFISHQAKENGECKRQVKMYLLKQLLTSEEEYLLPLLNENISVEELSSLQIIKTSPLTYYLKGVLYDNLERYEEAIDCYTESIRLNSSYIDAFYNRGYLFRKLDKTDKAMEDFSRFMDMDPSLVHIDDFGGDNYSIDENESDSYNTLEDSFDILQEMMEPDEFKSIVKDILSRDGLQLEFCNSEYKNDESIVEIAVTQNEEAILFASDLLRRDETFIFRIIVEKNAKCLKFIDETLLNDEQFITCILEKNPSCIFYLSFSIEAYYKYCYQVVKKDPIIFEKQHNIIIRAISYNSTLFHDLCKEQQKDLIIILHALNNNCELDLSYYVRLIENWNDIKAIVEHYPIALARILLKNNFNLEDELYYLNIISKKLKNKDIIIEIVKKFQNFCIDDKLFNDKKDREFILELVQVKGIYLEFADESLKKDREFVLGVVKEYGYALRYADESFKKDRKIVLEAVKESGYALEFADESFKKDREIVLEAVKQSGYALEFTDRILKKDREIVLEAVKKYGNALRYADESLKKDRKIVLEAVKKYGYALRYADESLKKDRKIVLEAVKQSGYALEFADESFKKDREIVLEAVKQSGYALEFADELLKKDREIVLEAVKEYGYALRYADESFKKDRKIVLEAVKQSGYALEFADESFKKDREIVLEAVKQSGYALEFADESFKKDRKIVLEAVEQNGYTLTESR